MRIFNGKLSGETSGGIFQGNITNLNALCQQILVSPATETTQYTFKVINPDNKVIFERTSEVGSLAELTQLPLIGTYTFNISSATADELFEICLVSRED